MNALFQKIIAFFMSIVAFFSGLFGLNKKPEEPKPTQPVIEEAASLDLTGYTLYFEDQFSGNALDYSVWADWNVGPKAYGFLAPSQISLQNGNLVLTSEYRQNGQFGAGWYGARICPRKWYIRGYYEIRCKVADGPVNCAFWLQSEWSITHEKSRGGPGGAEIDIMESYLWGDPKWHGAVCSNIHVNGSDDDPDNIESCGVGAFYVDHLYSDYHTFGLKWTETEYIFYIDGKETARSSFANGVSEIREFMLVSVGLPPEDHDKSKKYDFLVDYVRIYQQGPELYSIPNWN